MKDMISYKTHIGHAHYRHLAIDIGYSRNKSTSGIMHEGIDQPIELKFGDAIGTVAQWIDRNGTCIIIIEAVLSTFHNEFGNPDFRGDFEQGRGWYYGPGVVTFAAAMRFLQVLRQQVANDVFVLLAEAFLSFKKTRSRHSNDAMIIFNRFWDTQPEKIKAGTEPILYFIDGVPSVRVFHE
jgi:hypothetical protein